MKICSSTLNFCPCGQVVHTRFEKMNGLRKVQKKGLKVGMFLTRNERLICGRPVQVQHVLLESSCAIVGRYIVEFLYEKKDEICIKRQPVVIGDSMNVMSL